MAENADPSSAAAQNARLGGQQGGLKAVDISEADTPSRSAARRPSAQQKVVPLYQRTFVRPGRLLAPPVPAARHVLLAMSGGALIFFIAGGRFDEMLDRVRGRPVVKGEGPEPAGVVFQTILGWGIMLTILIFMADTGVAAPLAIGFSWLIFLMILMSYGEEAAKNITGLLGVQETSGGAGGGKKK